MVMRRTEFHALAISGPIQMDYSTIQLFIASSTSAIKRSMTLYKDGMPVKTSLIYEAMKKKGCTINSADPMAVVSSYLNKSDVLESIRGKGWVLKQ